MTRPTRTAARPSFTMLELLVVIGIILALVSLSVAGIMKGLNYQQRRNTETAISKVDAALQKQWLRVIETAKNEAVNSTELALANNDPRWAQVIHIKLRLIQMFPTSIAEAQSGAPLVGTNPAYVRATAGLTAGTRSWQDESSACLYMILKQSIRGGDFDPDTSLSSQEATDPFPADGQGLKEILDGWGKAIVFCRFPGIAPSSSSPLLTIMPKGSGVTPTKKGNDPVDPENLLTDPNWIGATYSGATTCGAQFATWVHSVFPNANYDLRPVIFSQGSDGSPFTRDDIHNFDLTP
jgi:type II secretory pathway pseudopilin PulG